MIKKTFLSLLLALSILPQVHAYSDYIIASGESVGIELNSKGVMVVGFYKVNDNYIAKDAGLEIGDVITTVNDEAVSTISELSNKINKSEGNVTLGYVRSNMNNYVNLKLDKDASNTYKTGIYVKDSISGIGTLTYIDPNTKLFGALGHEIADKTTGKVLEINDGSIFHSKVTSIVPSTSGTPGEKNAQIFANEVVGDIFENTNKGLFGNYTANLQDKKLYKVAKPNDIKKGSAKILTVLNGNTVSSYNINITKIMDGNDTKNLLFEITDEELLQKTGGIIQGMSGSPIIQGDYIIGAVTHVVVDNPQKGYGIFITNMLEEAEN